MQITPNDYAQFVRQISKPGAAIVASFTPEKAELNHMVMGAVGEIGEVLEHVKKYVNYDKLLPMDKIVEELGDVEFYLQGIRNALLLERSDIIARNYAKLSTRYASGSYSNEQALNRADKANEPKA